MPPTCSCCEPGRHFQPGRRAMLAGLGALAALPMTAPTRRAMAAEAVPKTSLTADQALETMKK
ncbi:carbonic anhydrase, partial [Roseomonas sp. DSM 102946]|nr:carbonic anhydrase [Roseomonas sp. DSM 102946]